MNSPDNVGTMQSSAEDASYDSVFVNSRREAIIIFSVWVIALFWSVPYCYMNGYPADFNPATFKTTMGVPSWVFWGIAVPWLIADAFTIFFCLFVMKDDNLEAYGGESE